MRPHWRHCAASLNWIANQSRCVLRGKVCINKKLCDKKIASLVARKFSHVCPTCFQFLSTNQRCVEQRSRRGSIGLGPVRSTVGCWRQPHFIAPVLSSSPSLPLSLNGPSEKRRTLPRDTKTVPSPLAETIATVFSPFLVLANTGLFVNSLRMEHDSKTRTKNAVFRRSRTSGLTQNMQPMPSPVTPSRSPTTLCETAGRLSW